MAQIHYNLKLSGLFAKYLYQNRQLNLPGIGVFVIDPSIPIPDASDKNFNEFVQHIRYTQQPVAKPDPEFIDYIRTQTGKIRPLAESDLESFLSDGKILLNIGKPFYLEGIGSLQKSRAGIYDFTPGLPLLDRLENLIGDRKEEASRRRTLFEEEHAPQGNNIRKILIGISVIGGLIVIIWGGYLMFSHHSTIDDVTTADSINRLNANGDSLLSNLSGNDSARKDSINPNLRPSVIGPVNYKFIIEKTNNKARALRRYRQLKSSLINIQMETPDSTSFNLFFLIPSNPIDTTRIKDSLRETYGSRKVYVEQ